MDEILNSNVLTDSNSSNDSNLNEENENVKNDPLNFEIKFPSSKLSKNKKNVINIELQLIIDLLNIPLDIRTLDEKNELHKSLLKLKFSFFTEIMESLGEDFLKNITGNLSYKLLKSKEILFNKNEISQNLYIILNGEINTYFPENNYVKRRINLNNVEDEHYKYHEINSYYNGETFCEETLSEERGLKYKYTAIGKTDVHLLVIEKKIYLKYAKKRIIWLKNKEYFLKKTKFFQLNNPKQVDILEIFSEFGYKKLKKNEFVYKEGDPSDYFYMIYTGEFKSQINHTFIDNQSYLESNNSKLLKSINLAQLNSGEFFGEEEILMDNKTRFFSIKCFSTVGELFYLKIKDFFLFLSLHKNLKPRLLSLIKNKQIQRNNILNKSIKTIMTHKNLLTNISSESSLIKLNRYITNLKKLPPIKKNHTESNETGVTSTLPIDLSISQSSKLFTFENISNDEEKIDYSSVWYENLPNIIANDYNKAVKKKIGTENFSSKGVDINKRIEKMYPSLLKTSENQINFLKEWKKRISNDELKNSKIVRNVLDKLNQISAKSNLEFIQVLKKYFNFYSIKKFETVDLARKNIKNKFEGKFKMQCLEFGDEVDNFFNFKLSENSDILNDYLRNKRMKHMEIEELLLIKDNYDKKPFNWNYLKTKKEKNMVLKNENEQIIVQKKKFM